MTKKGARFLWTEDCQVAFDTLKSTLIGADVMALPTEDSVASEPSEAEFLGVL